MFLEHSFNGIVQSEPLRSQTQSKLTTLNGQLEDHEEQFAEFHKKYMGLESRTALLSPSAVGIITFTRKTK